MSEGFAYIDILLLAALAVFLFYRLYVVLGRRTGTEKPGADLFGPRGPRQGAPRPAPERAAEREAKPVPAPLAAGLEAIAAADPSFDPGAFLEGARTAFAWIVEAFAKGDTERLRPLLNHEVFGNFAAAIEARNRAGESHETTLVEIKSADIIEARLEGRTAVVTVKFVSDQVNVTRNRSGEVIEGDPTRVVSITDIWTFARNIRSRDPNWVLVATHTPS